MVHRAAEQAEAGLALRADKELLGPLEEEQGNLRSAFEWALGEGDRELALRLAGALVLYWWLQGAAGEGRQWLDAALAAEGDAALAVRAKAL